VPARRLLANVEGVMNGILVKGDAVGPTLYYGAGAGSQPTASAVVADLIDITRLITADPGHRVPHLAFQPDQLADTPILPIARSRPPVTCVCACSTGRACSPTSPASSPARRSRSTPWCRRSPARARAASTCDAHPRALEKNVNQAMAKIEKLSTVVGKVTRIRLEELL